jgi:2-polyprenyl-3-methyl-5-hydroxy-6-metoxy-1,4-benzoquinol methylase
MYMKPHFKTEGIANDFLNMKKEGEFPTETLDHCLICKDRRQSLLFWGEDDRYGYAGTFPIVKCPGCGLVYLGVRIHAEAVPDLYEKYYVPTSKGHDERRSPGILKAILKKTPLINLYRLLINAQANLYRNLILAPGMRVLDIGSGSGIGPEVHRILRRGGEWIGVDVDPLVCQALRNAGLQSFRGTIDQFQETNQEPFDYIILSQVLEHVYQPRQFLKSARALLRPRGIIFLSCPNYDSFLRRRYGQRWLHWHVPYHVAHYTRSTLTRLVETTGMRISRFKSFTPADWLYAQEQIGQGSRYHDSLLGKRPWRQRWLDIRFAGQHRLDRGDAFVAKLEIGS